ncbi:DUF481 domain-containing protein [Endozoicomonas numazuensis]|uniref:Peptide chain release factor RF-3 n=1 Tax=Endozoicomonas numazuensis TaxID=1137799 RepID=A0A081NL81_9GAMM|nr:DUF481 domain-containing protein [Endozoicomonas numazuensis]KEQ19204.1 hypothetical protein GZ78_04200 [Endozoicomonas numazuensis]
MKMRLAVLVLAGSISCVVQGDFVSLHNGSVIKGRILSIKDEKLQIDSGYGKLTVPLKEVTDLDSDEPVWIRFKGSDTFQQWQLQTTDHQLQLVSDDEATMIPADPSDFARLTSTPPENDDWRWSGHANAYANIQRGNTIKNAYNLDGRLGIRNRLNRHIFDWRTEQEDDDEKRIKDYWQLKYDYNRFLSPEWYLSGSGGWEKDQIKGLEYRVNLGLGLGHQFWGEPELNLRAELGASEIWEKFEDPGERKETPAAHWALHYDQLFWETMTLFHDQDIFRRFKSSSWLLQTATGIRYKLTDVLHMSIRYEFDYDDAPQAGKKKDDSALLFGLGASW